MWGFILALSVALAAAGRRHLQYDLEFAIDKTYIYDYEGLVLSGLQEQGFAKSGVKLKCRAEISGATPRLRLLKIRKIEVQEYNGIWPTDKFTSSSKLTRLLEKQLAKPIRFEYNRGQVGDLHIPDGISETTVNILRGIVNILQLTIRKSHNTYTLQENGIGGLCYNNYLIQEDQKANQLLITKSTDLNECEQRERMAVGDAYFQPCASCKQRNKNSRAAATYNYKVKGTEMGGRLLEADVREVHQFTPFNEIEGSLVFEARQRLVLQAVQEQIHSTPENNDYITKESLRYHFEKKLIQTPIHLLRTKSPESQINDLLHHLVQHDVGPLSKTSPEKFVELVKLFRLSNYENIVNLWKQFSGRTHYRRWFLDAVPSIGNHLSLRFLKVKLRELSEFEAAQAVPLAFHLIKADGEAMAEAKSLLEAVTSGHRPLLRKVAYLAYGSLVYKFCSTEDLCPEDALQPLYDLLSEATEAVHKEDVILALKSLGNAGQVVSMKRIMKYIPGFSSLASTLSLPVQTTAVTALKVIAKKHPTKVWNIYLQLYMDSQQHPVIRMMVAGLVMDSKPTATVVMAVAKSLMKESDLHVGGFVYYLMKRQSEIVTPDLHDVAAVCKMAVVMLKSKYEALRNEFRSRFHYDAFSDSLMSGIESTLNIIHNAADVLPVAALGRLKTHFMGGSTELFEIGYQAEGLQQLLMNRHLFSSQSELQNLKKIMEILRKLHDWKPLSSDEPLATGYLSLFGQEIFYHVINKNSLENIFKFLPSNKYSALRSAVNALQDGVDINWSKPLLSSENRLVVPTCVGLPLETSLYYSSVTRAQLQVQAHIIPEPKDPSFIQLLQSNMNLKSKFSLSMIKDIVFTFGVNTDLIQAGMELRTQLNIILPGNVEAAVNVEENHFKIEYIPIQQVNEVLSIRSKAFAVTRNAEDLAAAKMTPIVSAGTEPSVLKQTFNPRDLSAGDTPRTEGKFSAEVLSKENAYWSDQPHRRADSRDFSMCARTSHFGYQVCLEKNSLTAASARNCPLYHVVGEHSFKVIFKPAYADASVEKIQIEFQAGPGAAVKMVRSVNVRRTDGETREVENPMDHVALSKLKKILSSEGALEESNSWNRTSQLDGDSSSNSRNTTEFSMDSLSSAKSDHELDQEKTHKRHTKHKPQNKHQSKRHHKGQHKSQKPHKNPRQHHETDEIRDHRGHQKKEREMEVHCKCWTEEQQKHNKKQHGQVEDEKPHKGHGYDEDEADVYEMNHKKEQKHGKNKKPHENPQDKDHPRTGRHDGHEKKSSQEGEEHKHQHKNQKDGKGDEQEDQKHQHKSHEHEKHIARVHESNHKSQHETGENKNPHKDAQDEDHHRAGHQGHKNKNWQEGDDHQDHPKNHKEGQRDEGEDQKHQHKSHEHKEHNPGAHESNHKSRHETGENKNPSKDAQDENHHHAGNQEHKNKNRQEEDDHENHRKNHKDGQRDEVEDQKPQHKSQREEDKDSHHHKDRHERKHVKHQHKARNETAEDNRQEDHHDPEKRPQQSGAHHESTDGKKHCTCWRKPKEDSHEGQPAKQDHKGHRNSKCHSQEHDKGDGKKCKFQSSESAQTTKKIKGKHVKSSSSSSSSESSSQSIPEADPRKDRRKQQQRSSESSNSGQKRHDQKKEKSPKKPIENSREDPSVHQKHKNDPKHSHKIHWKTIKKSSKPKSADVTNCSDCGGKHRESSHRMNLFAPEIHTAKFWSTSTLLKSQRSSSSGESSSSSNSGESSSGGSSSSNSGESSSGGSSSSSSGESSSGGSSSSSRMNALPYENLSRAMSPNFVFLVKSIMSDSQHQGFQTTAYIDPLRSKAQLIAVPLNHKSFWKTCLDASVPGFHKATAMLRWGENCQDYKVEGKLSTGKLSGSPAVQLAWRWKALPTWLKSAAESLMAFAPGVAYTMGFSEMRHSNPSHQVTVQVAASTPDTYDTILKTPQRTFYKQAVPVPWDLALGTRWLGHLRLIESTNLPKVSSMVGDTHEAECEVDLQEIVTFDGRSLGCSVSPSHCYTVIAQDCTDQLRFLIAMKKTGQEFSNFEMNVKLGSDDIVIYSDPPEFRVLLNGMWLLLKNDTYTNEKDCIRIHKNATTVTIKAPKNGVELVSFNGRTAKVQISPLMHGRTCGLCGNADHCKMNDFQKLNRETARSCNGLVHSWTVPGNSCGSSCALGRQYIMLENERIQERQSTCYSVEPVLKCVDGCHPATTMPITVAFHCLPRESAVGLEDWRADPKASSEDLIKEVQAHTSCACAEKCDAI